MRTKSERLHNTYKKIKKKLTLLKAQGVWADYEKEFVEQPHRLAKDKVEGRQYNKHTNNKTKRHIHGNYQLSHNPSASDKRKEDSMDSQMEEIDALL